EGTSPRLEAPFAKMVELPSKERAIECAASDDGGRRERRERLLGRGEPDHRRPVELVAPLRRPLDEAAERLVAEVLDEEQAVPTRFGEQVRHPDAARLEQRANFDECPARRRRRPSRRCGGVRDLPHARPPSPPPPPRK